MQVRNRNVVITMIIVGMCMWIASGCVTTVEQAENQITEQATENIEEPVIEPVLEELEQSPEQVMEQTNDEGNFIEIALKNIAENAATILAALLGAFVGAWLNRFAARGKITAQINHVDRPMMPLPSLAFQSISGGHTKQLRFAKGCVLTFEVGIYNSSLEQNTIKNVRVSFYNVGKFRRKLLGEGILYKSKEVFKHDNVPGRTLVNCHLETHIDDNSVFEESTQIRFEFENSKGKPSSVLIDKYKKIDQASILTHNNKRIEPKEALDNKIKDLVNRLMGELTRLDIDSDVKEDTKKHLEIIREQIESDAIDGTLSKATIQYLSKSWQSVTRNIDRTEPLPIFLSDIIHLAGLINDKFA